MKECLGDYYEKHCLKLDTFGKVFGINSEAVVLFMHDSMLEHWCGQKVEITEENKKCDAEVTQKCPKKDFEFADGCKKFKEYLECMNKTMNEKCEDKEFTKNRLDVEHNEARKSFPFCKIETS
uniref:Uncharacterized protein n=1 Tax=Panagrolaimus sp. ES5 TaxID=591445 RepID=A0AC34FNP9_9BILA